MLLKRSRCHYSQKKPIRHVCALSLGSESHLPRLPPNARWTTRFKRQLQKFLIASENHPFTHLYLRSKAAIAFEKRRHGISYNWWLIHPCSKFRFIWDAIMALTFLFTFFMVPYMASFQRIPRRGTPNLIKLENMMTPISIVCLIDIIFNFITGFSSRDGHEILMHPCLIIRHYITTYFAPDLLSSIPLAWFPKIEKPFFFFILEFLPILKLTRLSTMRYYTKEIIAAFGLSRLSEHGIWFLCLTILIFHWSACFTFVFPFIYNYAKGNSPELSIGYMFKTNLLQESDLFIYVTSLHLAGANLCSYSFTEFKYTAIPDKVTRCILLLIGMGYYLYVIVMILQNVSSSAEPELKYQYIMYGVNDYINNKRLPLLLKQKLLHFYEYRFQGNLFKEKSITSTLSKNLKQEIVQHTSRILYTTELFRDSPRSFVNTIIGVLKPVIFIQDDVIYKAGTEGKFMYMIITGTVALITYSGNEIGHVEDGGWFGEISLFQADPKRLFTVITLEICEVLRLHQRDFDRLVPSDSKFYNRLMESAQRRVRRLNEIENENIVI